MTKAIETNEEAKKRKLLLVTTEPNAIRYHFDDLIDMTEWLISPEIAQPSWESHQPQDASFCKMTWDEAVNQALYGEAKQAKHFAGLVDKVSSMLHTDMPSLTHDVQGEMIDVGAYLSGEPECFIRKLPRPAPKCIPITVDMSFVWRTNAKIIENRAAAIVALVDEMQRSGMAVDFVVRKLTEGCDGKTDLVIDVDIPCRPVDINTVSFVCSTAFQRRFSFAVLEHYVGHNRPDGGGYSRGIPLERPAEPGFLFVGSYDGEFNDSDWATLESSKNHILDMVEKWNEDNSKIIVG